MLREPCLRTYATIDVLYLDNTNCDPNRTLPSRQRATQQIKEIIRSHPSHNVIIGQFKQLAAALSVLSVDAVQPSPGPIHVNSLTGICRVNAVVVLTSY